MSEPATAAQGGPDTSAAKYLIPGVHIAEDGGPVYRVLFRHPHRLGGAEFISLMLLPLDGGAPETLTGRADQMIRLATPAEVDEAEEQGRRAALADDLEQLVRDIRQQRVPLAECGRRMVALLPAEAGLTYSRTDPEAEPTASCPAGRSCTGRDGKPSPYACPECGHCSDHAGGCAARTDDGRCGCTGGGA